ncbi:MAG: CPBP family intramembrane metalloprotease [Chloroflexi bacterium]|nr:CPBP family intramembrane metalloprotease [Chloroflexota bacterium]
MMSENFLDAPQLGKTEWWRYFFGFSIVFFFWFVLGSIPQLLLVGFAMIDGNPQTNLDFATGFVTGIHPIINFVSVNLSFVLMTFGLFLVVRFVHKRPFRSLITPYKKINWLRVGKGFIVYLILAVIGSVAGYFVYPDTYIFTLDPGPFALFVIFIILMTPIQTSAEELLFRGYLLQAKGHFSKNFLLLAVINGVMFMLPHLVNPEVQSGPVLLALYFFGIGAFLAYITLRDNGMELALGIHAANNMFTAVFANYTDSVLQTESIFTITEINPLVDLIALIFMVAIFYTIFFLRPKSTSPAALLTEQAEELIEN